VKQEAASALASVSRAQQEAGGQKRSERSVEFGAFLRARRQSLSPEEAGLPVGRRRSCCLRREEVANLAGVSHAWYTRLEQGADVHPTSQVVDAIARALRLDGVGRRYLRRLAGLSTDPQAAEVQSGDDLQDLVDQFLPNPAVVLSNVFKYLAWNEAYVSLFGLDPGEIDAANRNLLWVAFCAPTTTMEPRDYESRLISSFRWHSAGRVGDPEFERLIDDLSAASESFRELWTRGLVGDPSRRCAFEHPRAGLINLKVTWLSLDHGSAILKVKTPLTGDDQVRLAAAI
jgi:transcriptional regulator with XRE-family HTH domain